MMKNRTHCNQRDHDGFDLVCGYPLPCPWHTVIIHADKTPPTVEIPTTARGTRRTARKLRKIAQAVTKAAGGEG